MGWETSVIFLDGLIEKLRRRSGRVSEFWLKAIGQRLRKLKGLDPSDAAGIAAIRNDTKLISDLEDAMRAAGQDTVQDAKALLKTAARLSADAAPVAQDLAMDEWISGLAEAAQGTLQNITRTSAVAVVSPNGIVSPKEAYVAAIDEVAAQLASGEDGLRRATQKVCKEFADAGLSVVEYESGRVEELGAATERNLKQAVHEVYQGVQRRVGQEYGADGVEISAHADCAPDHLEIQGLQFTNEEYEQVNGALRRKIGTWNCRHVVYSIIVGVTPPTYTPEELAEMKAKAQAVQEFDGKQMTTYEATQLQRRLEREIRRQKNRSIIAKAAGDDEMRQAAQMRIDQLTGKYQEVSDAFGLKTQAQRMSVSGYRPVKANPAYSSFPGVDKNKKPLHPINSEIDKAESFEDLQKMVVRYFPGEGERTVLNESIGKYPLEVQKEIVQGLSWARTELNIKTYPKTIRRAKTGKDELGNYVKELLTLRPSLTLEQAFPTAVHEMVHHCQELRNSNCDKILEEVAASIGLDRRTNEYTDMVRAIAGEEGDDPFEVIAYAISGCSVGKGNPLAQALFEKYRWKITI